MHTRLMVQAITLWACFLSSCIILYNPITLITLKCIVSWQVWREKRYFGQPLGALNFAESAKVWLLRNVWILFYCSNLSGQMLNSSFLTALFAFLPMKLGILLWTNYWCWGYKILGCYTYIWIKRKVLVWLRCSKKHIRI